MKKQWLVYAGFFLAGVVLANRVRAMGPLSKIPSL
jgi:hypothetical protein